MIAEATSLKLLIIEENNEEAGLIALGARLTWQGCQVTVTDDTREAEAAVRNEELDVVILGAPAPPADHLELCRQLRAVSTVPIIMLLSYSNLLDRVRALDSGADYCISKPVDSLEFFAQLRALLRRKAYWCSGTGPLEHCLDGQSRTSPTGTQNYIAVGDLEIDTALRQTWLGGQAITLTSTEYRLLEELARHPGAVLSHTHLLRQVWGPEYVGEDHYLKVFVRRLRSKLGDSSEQPRYIQTEWGRGYRLVSPQVALQ